MGFNSEFKGLTVRERRHKATGLQTCMSAYKHMRWRSECTIRQQKLPRRVRRGILVTE